MALWGGRFSQGPEDSVFALSRSIHFDWRLAPYDLRSSIAHLAVLKKNGLINGDDAAAILAGLKALAVEVANGEFQPIASDEDVHSALERGLTEKLGEIGGALRAGRSRNDQVTTDLRLFAIDHMLEIAMLITKLQDAILSKATEYVNDPAPGFTHIQHAQPVSFGHELAKHAHAFARDLDRIDDWLSRTSVSSLGAGALAGSSLALDPAFTAANLGFQTSFANSIDAVSDRDYVAEALFIFAMIGTHLSRIGEEWTLWSSTEFAWAKVADAYSTGSSIMPQKKNPDMAELARGKSGRLIGNLMSVLTMLKGLPFAYNRDLQEDKEPLFDSIDTLLLVLPAVTGMISTTDFDRDKMALAAPTGFSLATEIADYLAKKRVPFSQAHEAAGECVALCEASDLQLHQLTDAQFLQVHPQLDGGVRTVLTVHGALNSRTTLGGTAPALVATQIEEAQIANAETEQKIASRMQAFSEMMSA
ncbi:MAG: argininosuccinate lyase [Actinobacteria bacterium]|jgi:argininosuccinate lyase|nr:argininosuccinate lyase [Actinomycetota bacterium]